MKKLVPLTNTDKEIFLDNLILCVTDDIFNLANDGMIELPFDYNVENISNSIKTDIHELYEIFLDRVSWTLNDKDIDIFWKLNIIGYLMTLHTK